MTSPWSFRDVAIVLPLAEARSIFDRAERYDVERGGRFDRQGAAVLIWSAGQLAEDAEAVGAFWVRWRDPTDEQATIVKIEWDPAVGGSEAEVWHAIAVLAGRDPRTT